MYLKHRKYKDLEKTQFTCSVLRSKYEQVTLKCNKNQKINHIKHVLVKITIFLYSKMQQKSGNLNNTKT